MSINHFSSDLSEAVWWAQQHHKMEPSTKSPSSKHHSYNNIPTTTTATATFWTNSQILYNHRPMSSTQNSAFGFDLNNEDDEEIEEQLTDERENMVKEEPEAHYREQEIPKQPLFEKPLTPSDVGKLNRLVIPKQHAEKYFPLNGNDSGEKGLLLSFEDELGKPWKFRYSYWNSSQSYVLTKGWSRFVKEKRLDAGDIVLFERHRLDSDRLFIGWRRRTAATNPGPDSSEGGVAQAQTAATVAGVGGGGGGGGWTRLFFSGHLYPAPAHGHGPPLPYQPDCLHAAAAAAASVLQSQTTPSANANSKRLRLFGVNLDLECQPDDSEPPTPEDGSSASSQGQIPHHYQYYTDHKLHPYNHHNLTDINFPRDVNQTRYHQG